MKYISYITAFSILIPTLTGIVLFKDLGLRIAKVFLIYLACILFIEFIGVLLAINSIHNHHLYNIMQLINAFFVAYIFSSEIKFKYSIAFSWMIIIALVINTFYNNLYEFNKYNFIIISLFQGIVGGVLLNNSIDVFEKPLYTYFQFWFYAGLLIASFSTITMYLFMDFYERYDSNLLLNYYYIYNLIITIFVNFLYTKAFLCLRKNSTY